MGPKKTARALKDKSDSRTAQPITASTKSDKNPSKKPFKCSFCPKTFAQSSTQTRHELITHPKEAETGEKTKLKPKYQCLWCPKICPDKSSLEAHTRTHTGEKPYKCGFCPKDFAMAWNMRSHEKRVHGHLSNRKRDSEKFQCDICSHCCLTQASLDFHHRSHFEDKLFKCDFCEETFKFKYQKNTHELKEHQKETSLAKPSIIAKQVCSWCSRVYSSADKLKFHMRSHTGERPYECKLCGMKLIQFSVLLNHERTHDRKGLKPFKCYYCPRRLADPKTRVRHETSVHGRTDRGPQRYRSPDNLTEPNTTRGRSHVRRSDRRLAAAQKTNLAKSYKSCDYCPATFSLFSVRMEHERQEHAEKLPELQRRCRKRPEPKNSSVQQTRLKSLGVPMPETKPITGFSENTPDGSSSADFYTKEEWAEKSRIILLKPEPCEPHSIKTESPENPAPVPGFHPAPPVCKIEENEIS